LSNRTLERKPLLIGLRAARANFLPGLILQVTMLGFVLAYYWQPSFQESLNVLALWKERYGYSFSVGLSIVAGALVPEFLKITIFQRGRFNSRNLEEVIFGALFWGVVGIFVDLLYRYQAVWFGSDVTLEVLIKKVVFDQFIYCPFFAAPLTVWVYEWKNRRYAMDGLADMFTVSFYRTNILPTLIASWAVWIPLVSIIYSLPPLLQVPLFGLALSFWVLLVTYITSVNKKPTP